MWRQALPVDPSLGEYPEATEVRPGMFTRFVPVAGRDGQLARHGNVTCHFYHFAMYAAVFRNAVT